MKKKLTESLTRRLAIELNGKSPVKFVRNLNFESLLNTSISTLYLYTRMKKSNGRKHVLLTEVISAIGHSLRNEANLPQNSSLAAKAGAFVLYSFDELQIIELVKKDASNGHQTYTIDVINDDALTELWESLDANKIEKLPSTEPYPDWTSGRHVSGTTLVKTSDQAVINSLTPETHPIIFNLVNKAQHIGWCVNKDIHDIYSWALRNHTAAFSDIWDLQNPEARKSKIREANTIGSIAARFLDKTFYHLYTLDFRGRKYVSTAYFHEQGPDLARGLLLRDDKKAIGQQGFFWLCISIAGNWANSAGREDGRKTDKIPLNDRVNWVLENEEIILSYAESPKLNQGWMEADSPWQFLAACFELKKFRAWQLDRQIYCEENTEEIYDEFGYESHLEVFIDGSNNGSQHLTALTQDEVTAPHVNLVELAYPGDLYAYVAEHVWLRVANDAMKLDEAQIKECDNFIDTIVDMKTQMANAPSKSNRAKELLEALILYKKEHEVLLKMSAPVFWKRITEKSHRRKICKRGTMTLAYGSTPYGMGQQVIDDAKKHGIPLLMSMEHTWGSYMGRLIYEDCRVSLKRPTQLLGKFEAAGKLAEQQNRFLRWTVPITNFPVVQHYTEGIAKDIHVQYGPPVGDKLPSGYYPNNYFLSICFLECTTPSKRKQSQGAAPNAVHSLDAAHLAMIVDAADFGVTTIHDSFGCLLADMPELFELTREMFVTLYVTNPLHKLLDDIGVDAGDIELGTLDINQVLDSEYCFV